MQDYEIAAMRAAHANVTWQEIRETRDRYARHDSAAAKESAEFLQQLLEEKIAAEDAEQSPTQWSKSNPEKPRQ